MGHQPHHLSLSPDIFIPPFAGTTIKGATKTPEFTHKGNNFNQMPGANGDGHHDSGTQFHSRPSSSPPLTKPNPKLLSIILKALIMSLLTSLFFLFLGVAAILLIHLCLAGRHLHRTRRRSQTENSGFNSSEIGYSSEDLQKLSHFRYVPEINSSVSAAECVVCLENFREGDICRSLSECNHVFHSNCIDSWLVKVPACPLCRARVRLNLGASSSVVGAEEFKQSLAIGG